jgi:hypothetical protein
MYAAAEPRAPAAALHVQAKDQAELNELLIWAAARGLLADVRQQLPQAEHHLHVLHAAAPHQCTQHVRSRSISIGISEATVVLSYHTDFKLYDQQATQQPTRAALNYNQPTLLLLLLLLLLSCKHQHTTGSRAHSARCRASSA